MTHDTFRSRTHVGRLWSLAAGTCIAVAILVTNVACNGQISKDADLKSLLSASQMADSEQDYRLGLLDEMTDQEKANLTEILLNESDLAQESREFEHDRAKTVPISAEKQKELRRMIESSVVLDREQTRYWLSVLPRLTSEQERKLRRIESNGRYEVAVGIEQQGNHAQAVELYKLSLEADPTNAAAHNNLAWLLATSPIDWLRDGSLAIRHARDAVASSPTAPYKDTLAAALAEVGDFDSARELQDEILPEFDRQDLLEYRQDARRRYAAYDRKRTWVEANGEGGPRKP